MKVIKTVAVVLTFVAASTTAPLSSNSVTILTCPSFDARCNALRPFCTQTHRKLQFASNHQDNPKNILRWQESRQTHHMHRQTSFIDAVNQMSRRMVTLSLLSQRASPPAIFIWKGTCVWGSCPKLLRDSATTGSQTTGLTHMPWHAPVPPLGKLSKV